MRSSNQAYFEKLDHVRLFAATLVLLYHTWAAAGGQAPANWGEELIHIGHTGVTLFLVLSGFLFTILTQGGAEPIDYRRFVLNRVLRIFPLLGVLFITALALARRDATVGDALSVILFSNLGSSPLFKFNNLLWTVAVECQFYLLFPFLIRFAHQRGPSYLIGLAVFWIVWRTLIAALFGAQFGDDNHYVYFTLLGRLDQFLIGMLLGLLHLRAPQRFRSAWVLPACGALALTAFHIMAASGDLWRNDARFMWLGAAEAATWGALLVAYFQSRLNFGPAVSRAFARLGQLSYSLYLMHIYVVQAIDRTHNWVHFTDASGINAILNGLIVVLPPALLLSWFSYQWIESPFLGMRRRYLPPPTPALPAAPAPRRASPG
ncbi:acyltransferase family protein [Pandoraea terrae]|nr:acyltransferase [Pandoraea terrae]